MKCPSCGSPDSKVLDSRATDEVVRRRRQCLSCEARFTTYERLQPGGPVSADQYVTWEQLRQVLEARDMEWRLKGQRDAKEATGWDPNSEENLARIGKFLRDAGLPADKVPGHTVVRAKEAIAREPYSEEYADSIWKLLRNVDQGLTLKERSERLQLFKETIALMEEDFREEIARMEEKIKKTESSLE